MISVVIALALRNAGFAESESGLDVVDGTTRTGTLPPLCLLAGGCPTAPPAGLAGANGSTAPLLFFELDGANGSTAPLVLGGCEPLAGAPPKGLELAAGVAGAPPNGLADAAGF